MFLGDDRSVYILDKAEGNHVHINGHPAWASVWYVSIVQLSLSYPFTDHMNSRDIETQRTVVQDVPSNTFCASGMHLPDGVWATFGGNDAVAIGGNVGSQQNPDGTGAWDSALGDFDGRQVIRTVSPCSVEDHLDSGKCKWNELRGDAGMKTLRWYSSAEATGEGQVVIIGGFRRGGYINRDWPMTDRIYQEGKSEPTYEYFPPRKQDPAIFQFLVDTAGLNAFAHTFLMPDGRFFVQANLSSGTTSFNALTLF